ncbi:DUF3800 domain-containing protein [Methanimicrococcus hacksteinii]|uniref:DUF3800 domain-containing protein n=1 Tax=Methanimicrococcus hacksteinii TaxID=3028293 RepID=UPI00298F0321|nr:DUF3800 domain-containing protein [Methanimicrococcus sp. At1]
MYIDESGDLGFNLNKSSAYFIVTALFVSDFSKLDKIIKKLKKSSFQKEFIRHGELKGYKSSTKLKITALKKLNEIENLKILHIILYKEDLFSVCLRYNSIQLYNLIATIVAEYIPFENESLEVQIDKTKAKQSLRDEFDQLFSEKLFLFSSCRLQNDVISHSDSKHWSGLQFADLLAWSKYQEIYHKNSIFINCIDDSKQEEYHVTEKSFKRKNKMEP